MQVLVGPKNEDITTHQLVEFDSEKPSRSKNTGLGIWWFIEISNNPDLLMIGAVLKTETTRFEVKAVSGPIFDWNRSYRRPVEYPEGGMLVITARTSQGERWFYTFKHANKKTYGLWQEDLLRYLTVPHLQLADFSC